MNRLERMIDLAKANRVRIRYKDQSFWMSVLGKVLWFNPKFTTHFTTVIGDTIWFPNEEHVHIDPDRAAMTIAHEMRHVLDRRAVGDAVFVSQYLGPQIQAVWAILSPLGIVFPPLFLLAASLLWALPWRSPMRAHYEERGYRMTLSCAIWLKRDLKGYLPQILSNFDGPNYYWMAKGVTAPIRRRLELHILETQRGVVDKDPLTQAVHAIMTQA